MTDTNKKKSCPSLSRFLINWRINHFNFLINQMGSTFGKFLNFGPPNVYLFKCLTPLKTFCLNRLKNHFWPSILLHVEKKIKQFRTKMSEKNQLIAKSCTNLHIISVYTNSPKLAITSKVLMFEQESGI